MNNISQSQHLSSSTISMEKIESAPKPQVQRGVIQFNGKTYNVTYKGKGGQPPSVERLNQMALGILKLADETGVKTKEGDVLKATDKNIKHLSGGNITNVSLNNEQKTKLKTIFKIFSQSFHPSDQKQESKGINNEDLKDDFGSPGLSNSHPHITLEKDTNVNRSSATRETSKTDKTEGNNAIKPQFSVVKTTVSPETSKTAKALLDITKQARDVVIKKQNVGTNVKPESSLKLESTYVKVGDIIVTVTQDNFGKMSFSFPHQGKPVVVNEFTKDAYRGPQHADFKDRLSLLDKSLKAKILESNWDGGTKSQLNKVLDALVKNADNSLSENAKKHPDINPTSKEGKEHFDSAHAETQHILSQFVVDASSLFSDVVGGDGVSINDIKNAEINYVTNNPRPTVINKYEVEFQGETKSFVSIQQPRSQENKGNTIPSSNRTGETPGLVNYVTTSHGVIEPGGEVRITYEGIRHSSYPPIAKGGTEKLDLERNKMTVDNVKECLRDIARDIIKDKGVNEGNSKTKPLVVSLRTMMLLTAKVEVLDNFRNTSGGKWKGESETLMLKECYGALKSLDGNTFSVKIDGKDIWIKPDIKVMNLGINKGASPEGGPIGKIPNASIHKEVNQRGFDDFVKDTSDHLQNFMKDSKLSEDYSKLQGLLNGGSNKTLSRIGLIKEKISKDKEVVRNFSEKRPNESPQGEKVRLNKVSQATKRLVSSEEKLKGLYNKLQQERKVAFSKNGDSYKELSMRVVGELKKMKNPEAAKMGDLLEVSTHAIGLYLTKENRKLDKIMDFQSDFLIANQLMGNHTEFFCKSAEDRTGNQNNRVEEQLIYKEFTGKLPLTDKDKENVRSSISSKVHMFSASQDNTFFNSYARGLQVGGDTNRDYSELAKKGKAVAGLAKEPFSHAKKIDGISERAETIRKDLGIDQRTNVPITVEEQENMANILKTIVQKGLNLTKNNIEEYLEEDD